MTWISVLQQPPTDAGTYPVKLFTGIEREAYWTGEKWVQNEAAKGRQTSDKHLTKLLRYWKQERYEKYAYHCQ